MSGSTATTVGIYSARKTRCWWQDVEVDSDMTALKVPLMESNAARCLWSRERHTSAHIKVSLYVTLILNHKLKIFFFRGQIFLKICMRDIS